MSSIINPRVAIVFKKIFGVKKNKDILITFINSIVSKKDQINKIKLLNPYNEHDFKQDDLSTITIKAGNKHDNSHLLITVQLVDKKSYLKQGYSLGNIYSNKMVSDNLDQHINKTIMIHVLNFNFIDYGKIRKLKIQYMPEYHYKSTLRDSKTGIEFFKDIEIHTLELKKFATNATDLEGIAINIEKSLDQWMLRQEAHFKH
jgi:predicted transposase/invertase (TIGR01784 family)